MKWISLFYVMLLVNVQAQTITDVQRLYKDLMTNYTKEVMPTPSTETLHIGISFLMVSINFFRAVEESISLTGCFHLIWHDTRLEWTPSLKGNLSLLMIDPNDIWLPPLVLINRVDKIEIIGDSTKFPVSVNSSGYIRYSPGTVADVKCTPDISKFPFDRQICTLEIVPWGVDKKHLSLTKIVDVCLLMHLTPNSDWTLEKCTSTVYNSQEYSIFYVTVEIKRQPLYYTIMVVFPTFLFGFLNPLVFIVPVETGERIGLAITLLLSYAIFLTLASASVPATSNPMCTLLIIMIVIITVSGVILYGTTLTIKYHYKKKTDDIWSPLKGITEWILNKKLKYAEQAHSKKKINVSKDDIVELSDSLFFFGSYMTMIIICFGYFLYVLI
ncbi:acetylcholine receptor subunit alpha-like 2 [Mytilus edulis]|uniref:acetylcholine receptor subunit alpha-like 2 n=1 Tax=Mytilus edulis TaxID=6550 RepID=UPI0039EF661D